MEKDELYDQAARIVVETRQASISYLQRKMRIGFSRAARLVDMMEVEGLVSPSVGGKPREVLVPPNYFDEIDDHPRGRSLRDAFLIVAPARSVRHGAADPIPCACYSEAMARETALRADLSNPAVRDAAATRRRLRTLVGAYGDLARLFPASGIGDKALWQGGMLAADAFWQWGEPVDRATALRAFQTLRKTYPVSTLTRQSQAHVKRLADAPVAEPALARAPAQQPAAPAPSAPAPRPGPDASGRRPRRPRCRRRRCPPRCRRRSPRQRLLC